MASPPTVPPVAGRVVLGLLACLLNQACGTALPVLGGASGVGLGTRASDSHHPQEIEIRAELTAEGHALLAAQGGWSTPKVRTDLYFDAFDGQGWAWKGGKTPWKLRIKRKAKASTMQLRRPLSREQAPADALPLVMNVSESWEQTMLESQSMALWEPGLGMLSTLQQGGFPTRKAMTELDRAWQAQLWAGADAFAGARKAQPGLVVPTYRADKNLLERKLSFGAGWKAEVTLGTHRTLDGAGQGTIRHEVEIAPSRNAPEAAQAMKDISDWLRTAGLTLSHLAPTPADPTLAAAKGYARVGAPRTNR
ncbi:MAG: hypothetical protein VKO21_00865 [Candidatus Sericytochromatia bacterium]|nr:hypothetical protein [Candidatus Sericytochromatia bacterium]